MEGEFGMSTAGAGGDDDELDGDDLLQLQRFFFILVGHAIYKSGHGYRKR